MVYLPIFIKFSSIFTIWELYPPGFHHLGNILSPGCLHRSAKSGPGLHLGLGEGSGTDEDRICCAGSKRGLGIQPENTLGFGKMWLGPRGGSLAKNTCSSDLKQKTLRLNQPTWFFFFNMGEWLYWVYWFGYLPTIVQLCHSTCDHFWLMLPSSMPDRASG